MNKLKIVEINKKKVEKFADKEWKRFNKEAGFLWKKKDFIYAAYLNNKLAGYFKCRILGGIAELKLLLVAKELRNKGIGEELIKKCEELAKKKRCFKIKLFTSNKHAKALVFYKRLGYKKEAELKDDLFHFNWFWLNKRLSKK